MSISVSLFTSPDYLIEAEGTVSAHAFLATNGVIPEGGLVVSVDAPNLSEFDLAGISVEGGEIAAVRDGGFDLLMTQYTTLVNLPIADDGETETGETATFSLAAGEGYEIVEDYSSGSFNLVDTEADIPLGETGEPNQTISTAIDTGISPENPSFSATDSIYFDIGNRYLNSEGIYQYIDYSEDVDVYKIDLSAGDTIAVETFDFETNPDGFGTGGIFDSQIYDADGIPGREFRIAALGRDSITLAAPDKRFGGIGPFDENETDSYQEFTASEDGSYYLAISGGTTLITEEQSGGSIPSPFYDPFVPGTGNGIRTSFGDYRVEIDLITEDNPRATGTPTPPVSNPDVTNPPTFSLSATPTTIDGEGNLTNAVVEFVEVGGVSSVDFTINAEGEIPEGGIEFVLNSNVNLFDYIALPAQNSLPQTVGGQSLGAFYNEDGIPTGIRLRIEEPRMTVTYLAAVPDPNNFFGNINETFMPLETDGAEDVTFFLQSGEGYEIAADAGETDVIFYDSLEDVPDSTGGGDIVPEVGVTASETELIDTVETDSSLTFSLSDPAREDGLIVLLDSGTDPLVGSALGQFDVLNAEVTGGDFPIADGDRSGFFFNITEQTATITLSVFNELTIAGIPEEDVQEGILALDFALQPQAGYTIDSSASEVNIRILDNPDSQNQVGFTGSTADDARSTTLIESEGTVGVLTFGTGAPPPEEGLTVSVSSESLDDFDSNAIEVTGGTVTEVRDDGFDLTLTEQQVSVSLPILEDGTNEGSENATFTIDSGDSYEINPAFNEVTFALADTIDQITVPAEIEDNDTLAEANPVSLSAENPSVSLSGMIEGGNFDEPEDVDLYSFDLEAGQTISLDIDTEAVLPETLDFRPVVFPALDDVLQRTDTELRLFDAEGNELAINIDGAAPDEEFSRDPYLEFTAESAGTYYVGVSLLGNRNYDPNVSRSGSGWTFPEVGVFFGDYELTASLLKSTTEPKPPTTEPTEPVFGSLAADIIEVSGTSQLIFGGDSDDLIDASISSTSSNRIYAGSGDDTVILGMSDRIVGGEGADKFFATSGGDNIITGGAGAVQFWLATADTPVAAIIITDFTTGEDVLGIAGLGIGFDDLTITQQDENTLIAANGSDLAILQGITADSLMAENFAFV